MAASPSSVSELSLLHLLLPYTDASVLKSERTEDERRHRGQLADAKSSRAGMKPPLFGSHGRRSLCTVQIWTLWRFSLSARHRALSLQQITRVPLAQRVCSLKGTLHNAGSFVS